MTKPDSVFVVSFSRLIWHVTLDGAFFGAFRSKQNALKGVNEARHTLDVGGRRSKVVISAAEAA